MSDPAFIALLEESVGRERAAIVLQALTEEPSVSIRLNPQKLTACPFEDARPVPWSPYGYWLPRRPVFTLDPLFHAGCYSVQDSSAMFAGHVFRRFAEELAPGAAVLDLCAAPGGKATDLAASLRERLGDRFSLLANEVMKSRYGTLEANLSTWGDPRVGSISRDPSQFGTTPLFDVILADVPCSGEGMFRKDPQAVADWNADLPAFCAARSRRILRDIWPCLKEGGLLIYSTCTFNHLENDDTAAWAADELGAEILPNPEEAPAVSTRFGYALLPGIVPGEGQYVAALRKPGSGEASRLRTADPLTLFRAVLPEAPSDAPRWDLDRETALRYLHGDAIQLPPEAPRGLVTLCYQGQPLGAGKNIGPRCNNLYPKSKRIRMDNR